MGITEYTVGFVFTSVCRIPRIFALYRKLYTFPTCIFAYSILRKIYKINLGVYLILTNRLMIS